MKKPKQIPFCHIIGWHVMNGTTTDCIYCNEYMFVEIPKTKTKKEK